MHKITYGRWHHDTAAAVKLLAAIERINSDVVIIAQSGMPWTIFDFLWLVKRLAKFNYRNLDHDLVSMQWRNKIEVGNGAYVCISKYVDIDHRII